MKDGIVQNRIKAGQYYKMAADKGHVESMKRYGSMLYVGVYSKYDKKESARYYKLAADQGNADAMYSYVLILSNGDGIDFWIPLY